MKKVLSMIFCVVMAFAAMTLPVFAINEATDGREIAVEATTGSVFADDEVAVTVKIYGADLADAKWTLTYNPEHFTLKEWNGNAYNTEKNAGTINGAHWITDGTTYDDGYTLETYTFVALAQSDVTPSAFTLSETYSYTYMEAMLGVDLATPNNGEAEVTIDLRNYDVEHIFDNEVQIDEDGNAATEATIPYDDETHTFNVKAYLKDGSEDTAATVQYRLADDEAEAIALFAAEEEYEWVDSIDDLKAEGEHNIVYRITPSKGYRIKEGSFTINIVRPIYEIEVDVTYGAAYDYVPDKKIVLVHTNTDNVYFTYDGYLMLDVTANGYTFEGETYKHVYAFVADAIKGGDGESYNAKIGTAYGAGTKQALKTVIYKTESGEPDTNLNGFGGTDIQDVTVAYGIINVIEAYFEEDTYQEQILQADLSGDKKVTNEDITYILSDAFGI